jgi:hypothetical protein
MKVVTKPNVKEEAEYYSDFSNTKFDICGPDVEVTLDFNYGSKYDGANLKLHLTDSEVQLFLDIIRENISSKFKQEMKHKIDKYQKDFEDSVDLRDWDNCEYISNNLDILKHILEENID